MCRAFLSPWKNQAEEYVFDSRFNMGVVSINLVQAALASEGDISLFWDILDERLELCKEALMVRYNLLKGTTSDISPIHWQHGAISRLSKGEKIDRLLENGYATITLGYIGLYEVTKYLTRKSHTENKEFSLNVLKKLKRAVDSWKEETGLGFALYGTPKMLGL